MQIRKRYGGRGWNIGRLTIELASRKKSDDPDGGNSHGPGSTTLRNTHLWVRMNVPNNQHIVWGWRLYFYDADGDYRCFGLWWSDADAR